MLNKHRFPNRKSINQFSAEMPETYSQALDIQKLSKTGHVIVNAPVKSGKRMLKIQQSLLDASQSSPVRHIYITALNRRDAKVQLDEMASYGLVCVCVTNPRSLTLEQVMADSRDFSLIKIHFDESDYGTGKGQRIDQVKLLGLANKDPRVRIIFYSATNEEIENSPFRKNCTLFNFTPAASYRGSKWFLAQKDHTGKPLVEEAFSIWSCADKDFTAHGKTVLAYLLNAPSEKKIGVVRFAADKVYPKIKPGGIQHKAFKLRLQEMGILVKFVDQANSLQWGRDDNGQLDPDIALACDASNFRTLLVINQTCSRSTEIGFHANIAFWHDYRGIPKSYNTMIQAMLRVAHYSETGHKIKLWGHVDSLRRNANEITEGELYQNSKLRPSSRISQYTENKYSGHERVILKGISSPPTPNRNVNTKPPRKPPTKPPRLRP